MAITKAANVNPLTLSEKIACYAQLFKLKLTSFVVISAIFGYFIGAEIYNITDVLILIIGGFLITCSSNFT